MFLAALILISAIALMSILIAIMTHAFEAHLASPRSRWHIEHARIIMQVRLHLWFLFMQDLSGTYFFFRAIHSNL